MLLLHFLFSINKNKLNKNQEKYQIYL